MSALALTLLRLGLLALLWFFVLLVASALRRDLIAPPETPLAAGLPGADRARSTSRQRRTRANARVLVVRQGSLAGTKLPLGTSPVTIGRSPDCTLSITDDYASGQHARLRPSEGRWIVEDLGSTNGTWIDRTRITGPTVLEVGAPLRIGQTVLELRK
ncbi:MAG: FHA domain-containing protein [Candidatus Nanopelagicales bacterium]|nr:FHA domain-containing protein [Candidatus Nanopelagicales bacterium]